MSYRDENHEFHARFGDGSRAQGIKYFIDINYPKFEIEPLSSVANTSCLRGGDAECHLVDRKKYGGYAKFLNVSQIYDSAPEALVAVRRMVAGAVAEQRAQIARIETLIEQLEANLPAPSPIPSQPTGGA